MGLSNNYFLSNRSRSQSAPGSLSLESIINQSYQSLAPNDGKLIDVPSNRPSRRFSSCHTSKQVSPSQVMKRRPSPFFQRTTADPSLFHCGILSVYSNCALYTQTQRHMYIHENVSSLVRARVRALPKTHQRCNRHHHTPSRHYSAAAEELGYILEFCDTTTHSPPPCPSTFFSSPSPRLRSSRNIPFPSATRPSALWGYCDST